MAAAESAAAASAAVVAAKVDAASSLDGVRAGDEEGVPCAAESSSLSSCSFTSRSSWILLDTDLPPSRPPAERVLAAGRAAAGGGTNSCSKLWTYASIEDAKLDEAGADTSGNPSVVALGCFKEATTAPDGEGFAPRDILVGRPDPFVRASSSSCFCFSRAFISKAYLSRSTACLAGWLESSKTMHRRSPIARTAEICMNRLNFL
mmetsp:Transcript_27434/g.57035  ORF Transcript_27434/g.57035 Transcript_27434/m.57035 type:complete len:205 (-) Transcript_27434:108-722(-)